MNTYEQQYKGPNRATWEHQPLSGAAADLPNVPGTTESATTRIAVMAWCSWTIAHRRDRLPPTARQQPALRSQQPTRAKSPTTLCWCRSEGRWRSVGGLGFTAHEHHALVEGPMIRLAS